MIFRNKLHILFIILIVSSLMAQENNGIIPFKNNTGLLVNPEFIPGPDRNETKPALFQSKPEMQPESKQKSVGRAFFMSLVLPGAGEYYMGRKSQAFMFLGFEVLAWSGLLANQLYSDHLKDEYKTFAGQHAGVQPAGKDLQYWIDIGKYDDIYSFNEQRRRDRYFDAIYDETPANYWKWDSRDNRFRYDGKRLRANEIASQDVYFYAAVLLNHLVSGINAMRLARKHNRTVSTAWHMQFESYKFTDNSNYFGMRFSRQF